MIKKVKIFGARQRVADQELVLLFLFGSILEFIGKYIVFDKFYKIEDNQFKWSFIN